ncbi:MAG: DUF1508 domain-containing protein [Hydrogenophaga sp.]|uniref:YegP family protein n=1 Tax=Hydrogenophaga sp. TaxID=1904254 RepID=UPI0027338C93|nr:DUF1508 domain-containing protein [Hydrogenophaga sp.]MDP3350177.1 DUF1508 domain-containing protein [Hydrogenophaga sp.]
MAGWYELNKNDKGQFSFVLKAANHQVISTSQMYKTAAAPQTGMESVKTNGPTTVIK